MFKVSRVLIPLMFLLLLFAVLTGFAQERPADNPDGFAVPETVTLSGSLQTEIGCDNDWDPACEAAFLTDQGDELWQGTFSLPAGTYEYKVALDGSWDTNYGLAGEAGGPNIPLELAEDSEVTFVYDHRRGMVIDSVNSPELEFSAMDEADLAEEPAETDTANPEIVNIPGTIQPALGCATEWAPDCETTFLEYNADWDVWLNTFEVPADAYEYKVALNGSWTENYGGFGDRDGANISLNVPEDQAVTFIYDHSTNWIMDDVRHKIVTAPGSYQNLVGCTDNWQPDCLATWLQDVDGDGIYNYTVELPAGEYEAKAAVGRSWEENYGADGVLDGENIAFSVPEDGTPVTFTFDANINAMVVSTGGGAVSGSNLRELRAYWLSRDTLAWPIEADESLSYQLLYSADASMAVSLFGLSGNYESLELSYDSAGLPGAISEKFPHLADLSTFKIAEDDLSQVPQILRAQVAIAAFNGDQLVNLAGLQIPGVLDDLYTYDGELGVNFDQNGVPSLTVWAPTAQNVELLLYDDADPNTEPTVQPMFYNAMTGSWRTVGMPSWYGKYYLYRVTVFAPTVQEIVVNDVTDPYSVSLSQNSTRSQILSLNDETYMPEGWLSLEKPPFGAPEDITAYELHIRDFSVFDESVPEELRGTYLAFTVEDSAGMQHLIGLAEAGLTHLHLLPSFDIATINENRRRQFEPDYEELAELPPDSEQQQALIDQIRDLDGFNWGYDPYHFNVPEGSYATDADGPQRILEYRQMVQALNQAGLRVVQDVVYNHTNASGQSGRSVLDKIVPGYYHRLNERGGVERSTCCENTATEHNMMRRLMIDSVILHAVHYKIDGFRFDLMGHHMLADMIAVREALNELTIEEDGVDGSEVYVYGEGWNFGEVVDNRRGVNATQLNIAGTGIGVFNDRLRDAVRGGNPFGDRLEQGLSNGQFVDATGLDPEGADLNDTLLHMDQTRIGLAGNLNNFMFEDRTGEMVMATEVPYGGAPTGYTADPQENIIYVSKHDNETLYDNNVYKAPADTDMETRVRMQVLGLSYVMYAQGVPFFHAGSDMLRSKSLDRNSYNSGDWFNRLDWTYQTNNYGVGLPPARDNSAEWPTMRPLLADTSLQATEADILANVNRFRDMLRVRYSSPLFRLQTGDQIVQRLSFYNTGPDQMPGVIVMGLSDMVGEDLDTNYDMILVIFNGQPDEISYTIEELAGSSFVLHPELANGSDELLMTATMDSETGTFSVPAYSAAVFVLPQS